MVGVFICERFGLLKPCSFPLYTVYKDYFFIRLLNKPRVEETPRIPPCYDGSGLKMQFVHSKGRDAIFLTQKRVFLQVKCPICAAGTGLVPVHPNAHFISQTQARAALAILVLIENWSKKMQVSDLLSDVPACSWNHFTTGFTFLCICKSRLVFPVQWLVCVNF